MIHLAILVWLPANRHQTDTQNPVQGRSKSIPCTESLDHLCYVQEFNRTALVIIMFHFRKTNDNEKYYRLGRTGTVVCSVLWCISFQHRF